MLMNLLSLLPVGSDIFVVGENQQRRPLAGRSRCASR